MCKTVFLVTILVFYCGVCLHRFVVPYMFDSNILSVVDSIVDDSYFIVGVCIEQAISIEAGAFLSSLSFR
jgi:hypothetical protein